MGTQFLCFFNGNKCALSGHWWTVDLKNGTQYGFHWFLTIIVCVFPEIVVVLTCAEGFQTFLFNYLFLFPITVDHRFLSLWATRIIFGSTNGQTQPDVYERNRKAVIANRCPILLDAHSQTHKLLPETEQERNHTPPNAIMVLVLHQHNLLWKWKWLYRLSVPAN